MVALLPRRPGAVTDLVSVTVVASRGWSAEAHATTGLLVGAAGVLGHLAEHGLSGLAVRTDGVVLTTPDLDLDLGRSAA